MDKHIIQTTKQLGLALNYRRKIPTLNTQAKSQPAFSSNPSQKELKCFSNASGFSIDPRCLILHAFTKKTHWLNYYSADDGDSCVSPILRIQEAKTYSVAFFVGQLTMRNLLNWDEAFALCKEIFSMKTMRLSNSVDLSALEKFQRDITLIHGVIARRNLIVS